MSVCNKKILIPTIVIMLAASFGAGALFSERYGWKEHVPSLGMQNHGQALSFQIIIEEIDRQNIEIARNNIEMLQNGNIVVLDQLVNNREENSNMYEELLQKIERYRSNANKRINTGSNDVESEITDGINILLKKYKI